MSKGREEESSEHIGSKNVNVAFSPAQGGHAITEHQKGGGHLKKNGGGQRTKRVSKKASKGKKTAGKLR